VSITPNSIPVAVALEFDGENAPRVTAKGRGELAQTIIDTARAHGVALDENPILAEALSHVELDEHIPEALYQAVAQVIGFVLQTRRVLQR
jgi:flagellar biosynthesis protein